ncbi:hypothetical protein [Escherichia coli]|uniref:hypothetical protein n=1 Tax=Escherichia coli TaxID=562 RepID=UPI003EB75216
MKLKKLPGFSLGLIALAVGNAYATQLLDDYSILSYITDEESPIEIKDNNSISNGEYLTTKDESGNDSNLLIVFYVQIMPDDFVMQLHRF